jgi:hypothetical protein
MRKLQIITWIDTAGKMFEAMDTEEVGGCVLGDTTGFLVKENDTYVALAMEQFEDGRWRHLVSIPKVCIKKRRTVWKDKTS